MTSRFNYAARAALLSLALALPAVASAHEIKAGALVLEHPRTRATPTGAQVAGGFLTIKNTGSEADRLIGGSAAFAGMAQLHEMAMDGTVMKMRELPDGITIPAGGEVTLKPGGYHMMFMGLKQPLTQGQELEGTLVFEKAGTVKVEWDVESLGATGPSD